MGRDPEALRACLEATERHSLLQIYRFEFGRFTRVCKPTGRREKQTKRPTKIEATREAIRPAVEAGEPVNRKAWAERLDVAEPTVQSAVNRELGRLEGLQEQLPIAPADITRTQKAKARETVRAFIASR